MNLDPIANLYQSFLGDDCTCISVHLVGNTEAFFSHPRSIVGIWQQTKFENAWKHACVWAEQRTGFGAGLVAS
jgi:hypothetical protein